MGSINWMSELPLERCLLDDVSSPKCIVLPRAVFDEIGDYTQSLPTSPSPGRIYRKALNWPQLRVEGGDPNWWVYICERDPADERYVLHHPFKAEFLDA